ncbi:addiction module antitoxin [Burkholderia cepacia]|uniref:type II toxin-antitoxin system RelE family toxin n=1 Tax=Burkholderia cepacia TaxID=292 RepID=UPI000F572D0D|nr:type II toxin-antitoxin system RelE/ParE family toxin [Burkholderia cepacia]RQT70296.1 addiction module antitoxin [Burkholderia cepacia]
MTFECALLEPALKAWKKLDRTVRDRFEARLAERLENPRIPSARPRGQLERDKIGLRSVRYCLVYEVREAEVVVRGGGGGVVGSGTGWGVSAGV